MAVAEVGLELRLYLWRRGELAESRERELSFAGGEAQPALAETPLADGGRATWGRSMTRWSMTGWVSRLLQ